jgi:hypothetical protein
MNATSTLVWGMIFGSIGLGFFIYGKKQNVFIPICCGLGLMVAPYFISNNLILIFTGLCLVAIPYFIRF